MDPFYLVAAVVTSVAAGFLIGFAVIKFGRFGVRRQQPHILWGFPDPVIGVTPSGTIRSLNPAAELLLGLEQNELRGMPIASIVRGATAHRATPKREPLPSKAGIESEAICRNGSTVLVRCLPIGKSFLLLSPLSPRPRAKHFRRCEDLLTEVNGHSELLLATVDPGDPMRPDLQQLNTTCAKAIAAFHSAFSAAS